MDMLEGDRDVFIQKYAADFISDFDRSLGPFLRKSNGQLRRRVRTRETLRLISQILDHFQELPQLLDPHLPRWLPVLASAFLECLRDRSRSSRLSTRSQLLQPSANAICRIIYTFCKIRGEKVIVRFLHVETKYLELLLQAIEDSEHHADAALKPELVNAWTWHERYVVLIWLSQLFFAPFDLSTISSGNADEFEKPNVAGFQWPQQVPRIVLRVIPLAIRYLASPGKERDGAKALLVRLAMRKDMQELGVLSALVQWALSSLNSTEDAATTSSYYYIGSLSFLAGILRAAEDTSMMDQHLSTIFYVLQAIAAEENETYKAVNGSALARKMMIKATRSIIAIVLRKSRRDMADTEMIEVTIGYLLERLADNDTPVRFAASKALSIITLKLDSDMASQVIEAVLDSLNRNVLWVKNESDPSAAATKDITAVDPLEWHGLMLTLAHLLYRRSPPPENLSHIIHALLMGLSFEKRSPSGGSTGTNVRDASCFGIWALARRYSTAELLEVETQSVLVARGHDPAASILQVIATELVVTASLDPAGNIRRGSSAALQELIGRHPDTVEQGIAVVQTVDYHAVALRSRAIHEVALQATRLSPHYGRALLEATLGWRGIGDMDAGARRVAAASFGTLTSELTRKLSVNPCENLALSIMSIISRIRRLQMRQVEERHGLLLSLAAVLDSIPSFIGEGSLEEQGAQLPISDLYNTLKGFLQEARDTKFRKPELIVEASSALVVSVMPILLLQLADQGHQLRPFLQPGSALVSEEHWHRVALLLEFVDGVRADKPNLFDDLLEVTESCVNDWLDRNEPEVIQHMSDASLFLLVLSSHSRRVDIIGNWTTKICAPQASRKKHGDAYFHALTRSQPILAYVKKTGDDHKQKFSIPQILEERWAKNSEIETRNGMIETRVAIMQSLVGKNVLKFEPDEFLHLISEGLDDYTTNARGDIGSHVRLEALKATKTIWNTKDRSPELVMRLFPQILRLAAEKLDRVRLEAKSTLTIILQPSDSAHFDELLFTSKAYFGFIFALRDTARLGIGAGATDFAAPDIERCTSSLLAGLVTSADTGNEDLVVETRAALAELCESSDEALQQVCSALLYNLKLYAGEDRVLVPTLEILAYLFHIGLLQRCFDPGLAGAGAGSATDGSGSGLQQSQRPDLKRLCLLAQKAAYKTGNVRKLEACIKVYGAMAAMETATTRTAAIEAADAGRADAISAPGPIVAPGRRDEGIANSRKRLGVLLFHPWPRIRSLVIDELWSMLASRRSDDDPGHSEKRQLEEGEGEKGNRQMTMLLGVDWSKADKAQMKTVTRELGLE
ncbi:tubulin folding cofactor D C terminal-domain-containing protein [Astrocystis sublimbata]|nr:tubulin folding cofactor D C terminal-domain-containing protein [Astrocystis sublimbata]